MAIVSISRRIAAPIDVVFDLCSDIEHAAGRIKAIKRIEMLTPGQVGVGTRFKETRIMFGREATEEMTFTGFEPPHGYVLEAHSCGTHYRTEFRLTPEGNQTIVQVTFNARPESLVARLLSPLMWLMKGMLVKCLTQDLDDVQAAAEAKTQPV